MKKKSLVKNWTWLKTMPTLGELCAAYPKTWNTVDAELTDLFEHGKPEDLKAYLEHSSEKVAALTRISRQNPSDVQASEAALVQYVQNRMANLAISQCSLSVAAGVQGGKIRFNLFNGLIAQKLLFARAFERKPVSLFWFRLFWPFLWQKKLLMPLVQPRGIYCFYSKPLLDELVRLIDSRTCLEIAAGDGTLTRFLRSRGIAVTATDNYGWKHAVQYPAEVEPLEAKAALARYAPEVVICSWPPTHNSFERAVFNSPSVQTYIVISSQHRFASGSWPDYLSQTTFSLTHDKKLSRLVLPPELESAVYIFERKPPV